LLFLKPVTALADRAGVAHFCTKRKARHDACLLVASVRHRELHRTGRVGWLRAAVLGANDGLISTSSLVIGVAAADAARGQILLAALAGLVSGAFSMAAGEYVSVSSQADTERADLAQESRELAAFPEAEHAELAGIYRRRGLTPKLARQVADELMSRDALAAHARDELGLSKNVLARPIQAALASAASFTLGALLPVILVVLLPARILVPSMAAATLLLLALLGAIAARLGGASRLAGSLRVGFWGAVAMSATALVGRLFGTAGL
jgi:VIT1/CCC1 family predicted Fe2+/Mn2+ transporter